MRAIKPFLNSVEVVEYTTKTAVYPWDNTWRTKGGGLMYDDLYWRLSNVDDPAVHEHVRANCAGQVEIKWPTQEVNEMTRDWFIKQVKRSEVDAELGMQNQRWVKFREEIQEDDELWFFCSPVESWRAKCGRSGYTIVRKGEIVRSLVTRLN
jgi:hypothetical protein